MRRLLSIAAAICILSLDPGWGKSHMAQSPAPGPDSPKEHLSDYVSTLVGTQSDYALSTGNTYPATALPWGMNFWTPMTAEREDDGWAYQYEKHRITGFKQTHQPSPWINDYGAFSIMPFTGKHDGRPASWFSHKSETARPYYYKVYLADYDVTVEITPSERAAIVRITFPESDSSGILVNPFQGGSVSFDGLWTTGFSSQNHGGVPEGFRNYFVIKSDVPIAEPFTTARGQAITLYIASSFISPEQAKLNLNEVLGKSFDQVCAAARQRWDEVLGRIRVSGGSEDRMRTFYSCLYRSTLFPRKFYEIGPDGSPVHYSPYNGKVEPGFLYTDTGFWDTFRALFPLLNFVYPDVNAEIQSGLANIARENDFLPEWSSPGHRDCMIGNNSASVVADAALQGITSREDLEVLYKALVHGTENVHPKAGSSGRKGHEYYNKLGYIPYDVGVNENVARTLEYAYDDWCLAKIASLLGRPKKEVDKYIKRSGSWRNVFDRESRLMRGRNADGSFQEPFSPYKWGDAFTEGNAWHYTWSVFHDIPGLMEAMGGEDSFVEMLDSVFMVPPIYDDSYYGFRIHEITEMQVADMGNYAHGNQPAQHMLYLYDWTSQPWKGRQRIRQTMDRLYSAAPDGYCGDEDNGQTSAWYVFSAMGFYPVCPGSGQYAIGIPLFKKAVISFPEGKQLEISAPGSSASASSVQTVSLNGKSVRGNFLETAQLKKGGKLTFGVQTKTTFQTSREWTPGCDNRADAAMIYGIGGDPCDDGRGNATFEERADTWAARGYQVHFMTGIAWGEYKDYYTGLWDGKNHFDESQMQSDGDRIMHGVMIPYFVPTLNYIEYLKTHIARVIDYGITEIFLEEPEFWARGGYSEAFKREWQDFYGAPWQAQHVSPGSAYLSNKLKYHLYYRAIDKVSSYAKEYGRQKGLDVHIYIPTHSLINYSQWAIVSPEASLASLPGIDGYIAQVWTNTAKEPGFYEGVQQEMVFEQAFMEYGCMQSMTAPTGRKMFFLTDPVEDKRRDWAEYKRNYEATFAAQLMYPGIDSYEVMPWPNRIYERKYRMGPGSDKWDYIPADYATQMQVMVNSLGDMPLSSNKVSGSHGISVLLANSLMFQRFPTFEGYDDPFLSNLMGQVWPLLKRGVPVGTVHIENLGYPESLKDTRVLLMSYSNMKPMEEAMHRQLAEWVKGGGIIVYSGRDDDAYQSVPEWWNSGKEKYACPSDHLFCLMGIPGGAKEGIYTYGKGRICILRQDPKEYVLKDHGYDAYLGMVEKMYSTSGKSLEYKNNFILERGSYDVVAVMDGPGLHLDGDYIDLFDCNLPVVHGVDVAPGTQKLLVNLSRVEKGRPCILASATRPSDIVRRAGSFSYIAKGPVRITNRSRVYLPSKPSSVLLNGRESYEESRWDSSSGTYLLEFAASPEGTAVKFIW